MSLAALGEEKESSFGAIRTTGPGGIVSPWGFWKNVESWDSWFMYTIFFVELDVIGFGVAGVCAPDLRGAGS